VSPLTNGSYRNHCPACLWSRHVDDVPGDRASECGGAMRPVAVRQHSAKGHQLVHRCERCGTTSVNRVAIDTEQPDDWTRVCALASVGGRGV
jgi:RNHCP domain-containing protein